jgi:hypothetical protein
MKDQEETIDPLKQDLADLKTELGLASKKALFSRKLLIRFDFGGQPHFSDCGIDRTSY